MIDEREQHEKVDAKPFQFELEKLFSNPHDFLSEFDRWFLYEKLVHFDGKSKFDAWFLSQGRLVSELIDELKEANRIAFKKGCQVRSFIRTKYRKQKRKSSQPGAIPLRSTGKNRRMICRDLLIESMEEDGSED